MEGKKGTKKEAFRLLLRPLYIKLSLGGYNYKIYDEDRQMGSEKEISSFPNTRTLENTAS
jgi:hypothetical protein